MRPSARREVPRETDQVKGQDGCPSADAVPQERSPNERALPRNRAGRRAPDERALETFVAGTGI
jgi:hypothetical protein